MNIVGLVDSSDSIVFVMNREEMIVLSTRSFVYVFSLGKLKKSKLFSACVCDLGREEWGMEKRAVRILGICRRPDISRKSN